MAKLNYKNSLIKKLQYRSIYSGSKECDFVLSNFAKNNPAAALATYDLGKGILGKIMKFRPSLKGGRAGLRSAAR